MKKLLSFLVAVVLISTLGVGCKLLGLTDDDDSPSYSISFTLDGTDYNFKKSPDNSDANGNPLMGFDSDSNEETIFLATDEVVEEEFDNMEEPPKPYIYIFIPTASELNSTDTYTLSSDSAGVMIGTADGNFATHDFENGEPIDSSTFTIELTKVSDSEAKGTFSGKIFYLDGSSYKELKDGSFTVENLGSM